MTKQTEIVTDLLASLVAAVSLLKRGPKYAAPSDKMFDLMILDYERTIERGRAYLAPRKLIGAVVCPECKGAGELFEEGSRSGYVCILCHGLKAVPVWEDQ
jgi:hypothetical protein